MGDFSTPYRNAGIWLSQICCKSQAVAMPGGPATLPPPSFLPVPCVFSVAAGCRPRLAPSRPGRRAYGVPGPEVCSQWGSLASLCFQTHLYVGKLPRVSGGHHSWESLCFRALPSRTLVLQINNPFLFVLVTFHCSDRTLTRVTYHGLTLAASLRMQSFSVGWECEVAGHMVTSGGRGGGWYSALSPLCLLGIPASGIAPPTFRVDLLTLTSIN